MAWAGLSECRDAFASQGGLTGALTSLLGRPLRPTVFRADHVLDTSIPANLPCQKELQEGGDPADEGVVGRVRANRPHFVWKRLDLQAGITDNHDY